MHNLWSRKYAFITNCHQRFKVLSIENLLFVRQCIALQWCLERDVFFVWGSDFKILLGFLLIIFFKGVTLWSGTTFLSPPLKAVFVAIVFERYFKSSHNKLFCVGLFTLHLFFDNNKIFRFLWFVFSIYVFCIFLYCIFLKQPNSLIDHCPDLLFLWFVFSISVFCIFLFSWFNSLIDHCPCLLSSAIVSGHKSVSYSNFKKGSHHNPCHHYHHCN